VDALSSALVAAAPQLGVAGVLLALLIFVVRNAASDRSDYRTALQAAQQRYADELTRINTDHDTELAELRADILELRQRIEELHTALDSERRRRWEAEDKAAEALRRAGGTS
jgi:Skp family chaperone for outer membrane proteins